MLETVVPSESSWDSTRMVFQVKCWFSGPTALTDVSLSPDLGKADLGSGIGLPGA